MVGIVIYNYKKQMIKISLAVLTLGAITVLLSLRQEETNHLPLFIEWKAKYLKTYETIEEEFYRLQIFRQNLQYINDHNSRGNSFEMSVNQFADLTQAEFQHYYLNQSSSNTNKYSDDLIKISPVDWVELGMVTPVKNQAQCGSEYAFAAIGAIESNSRIMQKNYVTLSEQDIIDCSDSYGNHGCEGGSISSSLMYVQERGIALEKDYPYKATDTDDCRVHVNRSTRIKGFIQISSCEEVSTMLLKGSVSILVDAANWMFYARGVFSKCENQLNHGAVLVGIDEAGVWKVKNNWGTSWGENGFIRLQSGNTCGICQDAYFPFF